MNIKKILLILLVLSSATGIKAQGIEFFKGSWEEALEAAKEQDKIIFVDAYTTWCGPCKRMAKNVFPDAKVGEVYNQHFIPMKIDMEKGEGPKFARKYRVASYPTLLYIDGEGKIVHRQVGAQKIPQFLQLANMVMRKGLNVEELDAKYEKGDRDPAFIRKYVKALNKAGKPHLKVANEYLKSQEDLTTPENLDFIFDAVGEADSRIFNLLIKHREGIEKRQSKHKVEQLIEKACNRTVAKAIEFESEDLLAEAKEKMATHCPDKAVEFGMKKDMDFALKTKNAPAYLKASDKYIKRYVKNQAAGLHRIADTVDKQFPKDNKALKKAEKWAKKAMDNGGEYAQYITYTRIAYKLGKKSEALVSAKKALDIAKENGKNPVEATKLVELIEKEI